MPIPLWFVNKLISPSSFSLFRRVILISSSQFREMTSTKVDLDQEKCRLLQPTTAAAATTDIAVSPESPTFMLDVDHRKGI
jgi:hypothetical protein